MVQDHMEADEEQEEVWDFVPEMTLPGTRLLYQVLEEEEEEVTGMVGEAEEVKDMVLDTVVFRTICILKFLVRLFLKTPQES